jgi:cell division protein FtsI (penicillin-binding protein 3)
MAETPPYAWRPHVKRRLIVAASVLLLWACGIEARLVYLQVIEADELSKRAERQQSDTIESAARRGEILDRQGRVLAYSVDAETVYVVPKKIADVPATVAALCGALADCTLKERQGLVERIRKGRHFAYVRRQVSPEQAKRVSHLGIDGVGFIKENKRFYPNKGLASHLLGYVGTDNGGLGGIEATYDWLIKGNPGTVIVQTDARRTAFNRLERPPTTGASIELTIDQYLQHIVERELEAGVKWAGAASGSVVVMDPKSGEVLALASYPTFNPNAFGDATASARRNRAVQDLYEPGSTFKIVTASALLEEKVVRRDEMFDVSAGQIRFGSQVIRDDHTYGALSFEDVIVKSSNVGTIKAMVRFGDRRAYKLMHWVRQFGFGTSSSPDFPGESSGIVWRPEKLNDRALASVSIGYQVAVTPLQMAAATSAVANGGELVQPRVVRAVIRNGVRQQVPRKVQRRAISASTAAEMTSIMEAVVVDGTGKQAQVPGYTVAGKTGTAQKVVNGVYSHSDYNVSFVGFLPSRAPKYTIVVVVDSPHAVSAYGGVVAAPIFQKIADAALRHDGVAPTLNAAPPLLVARRRESPEQRTAGPAAPPSIVTLGPLAHGRASVFPDLRGLSAREALQALARLGMSPRLHGDGLVVEQRPAPGTPIDGDVTATLWLEREPPIRLASHTP